MKQLNLLECNTNSMFISIDYSGFSQELLQHEINAKLYAISINGYSKFVQELISQLSVNDVEVYIVANTEGSFKSVVKIVWNMFLGYSAIVSALGWHGITPKEMEQKIIALQETIVELIADGKGVTEDIIRNIDKDDQIFEDSKLFLKKIIFNNKIRKSLDEFTRPLDRNGYEVIKVCTNSDYSFSIEKNKRESFEFIPPDVIIEEPFRQTVQILYLSPVFNEWKFQGIKVFWAEVQDQDFLDRTKNRLFSDLKGKMYLVSGTSKTIKKRGAKKGTTTWTIDKVSEIQERYTLL